MLKKKCLLSPFKNITDSATSVSRSTLAHFELCQLSTAVQKIEAAEADFCSTFIRTLAPEYIL